MKKKLSCSTILLLYALVTLVRETSAQCPANECTICTDTEIVCQGLDSVPPSEGIIGWSNMERISLTNGAISEIPPGYFNLSNLVSVNLSSNQLTTFSMESLQYASSLRTIDLTNNPIVCDNNIDWLQKWKTFYPESNTTDEKTVDWNKVIGTCTGLGEDINTYLSGKPTNLVGIKFANSTLVLDRACPEVTLPFVVTGNFTSALEYRAFIVRPPSSVQIDVVNEYITVPVGTNSSEVIIGVTNRGENRENVETLVQVYTKYPVSYETNVVVELLNGANTGCVAPVPVVVPPTPTPEVTKGVTTKPSVKPTQDKIKTMPPKASTEPAPTSEPKPTPAPRRFPVWVIIIPIIIIAVVVVVFIYIKYKRPNKTASDKPVEYKVVDGGDGKVYSDTTQDV